MGSRQAERVHSSPAHLAQEVPLEGCTGTTAKPAGPAPTHQQASLSLLLASYPQACFGPCSPRHKTLFARGTLALGKGSKHGLGKETVPSTWTVLRLRDAHWPAPASAHGAFPTPAPETAICGSRDLMAPLTSVSLDGHPGIGVTQH